MYTLFAFTVFAIVTLALVMTSVITAMFPSISAYAGMMLLYVSILSFALLYIMYRRESALELEV